MGSSVAQQHGAGAHAASATTFSLTDEDHTIGNSVRYVLNQDPRVAFCGYSVPHPSEVKVNVRIQTTGAPAREVFKDALNNLAAMCEHVRNVFEAAVEEHKERADVEAMEVAN
eukprot:jgi/Mesen1/6113/ME000310S05205